MEVKPSRVDQEISIGWAKNNEELFATGLKEFFDTYSEGYSFTSVLI